MWTKSGTILTSNEQLFIEEDIVQLQDLLYKTSLVIPALDGAGGDNGDYVCSVTISSANSLVTTGAPVMSHKSIFVEGS